jgi:hypothetical protein
MKKRDKIRHIVVPAAVAGFAEDKDEARRVRMEEIIPALERGEGISLDFKGVKYATQSFVHALIGEALKRYGDEILDRIEFKNCSSQLKNVIELVVDYSLGGFLVESVPPGESGARRGGST